MVDQVLSSLSNLILSVLVARKLNANAYGTFALSFSLYAYALTVSRILVSQPLTIRFSGARGKDFVAAARQSTGAALAVASLAGAGMVIAGWLAGGGLGISLATTGVLLPGLLVQDAYRMVFFAMGRPAAAAANDALWGVVQVAAVLAVSALGKGSAASYLWAWGLAGCLAGAIGAKTAGLWPAPRQMWHWLRSQSNLTRYSVTEVVVINGANQLTLVLVAALGGLSVVGTLRGGQILTAPTTVLALSTLAFVVPELARRPAIMGGQLIRVGLSISAAVTALVVVWTTILLLIPDSVGRLLLGETWAGTSTILVPTVIGMLAGVMSLGASSGVYARAGVGVLFPFVLSGGPVYLVAGLVGVAAGGAFGTAIGLAVAGAYGSIVSWVRFVVISRRPMAEPQR